ncbi:hypothetical protein [Nostoc sp.]|uniref:hypothetical protein n=1 Tax=Nostoc sp. TaxID=1180 RepID=UPI002FF8F7E1
MSKTDDALASQALLLNSFSQIIRASIQRVSAAEADRDQAFVQVAALLKVDEATASAILANNPQIQALIDEALAVLPPGPVPAAA